MIRASIRGPSFSHIFFANDIILFAKANAKNCNAILEVLNNFCNLARQRVNYDKSRVFFSSNVIVRRKRGMCRRFGIMATSNLGRYLRFPIIHKGRVGSAFNFIVDKVQSKLAAWKTRLLLRAGSLVLAKIAAAPIAEYYMQCQCLPVKVFDTIDKIMRDFIWGSTEDKRRMYMVKWSTITLPKELGGLGLYSIKHRNQAILAKLCWRLAHEEDKPWTCMLKAKYLCPTRIAEEGRKLPCSRIWATCKRGGPCYVKGLKWTVKSGEVVNMWMDFWLPNRRLRELIEGPLTRGEDELCQAML